MSSTRCCRVCGYRHDYATAALADAHFPRHSCARQHQLAHHAQRRADRPRSDCHHAGHPHHHGTRVTYVKDRCRCPDCTAANTAASHTTTRNQILGRHPYLDAAPVRAHIDELRRAGIGYQQIARLSDTSATHIREIAGAVTRSGDRRPIRNVRADTATRILRIAATPANRAPHGQIDATGTRRRLQALIAAGWPLDDLARRLQRTVSNMHRTMAARTVTARTAQHIADLHEQLWNIAAPHATEADRAASTAARNHAARHGWLPTLAWDDIDTDPHPTTPRAPALSEDLDEIAIERAVAGDGIRLADLTPAEQAEAIRLLTQHGKSIQDIAIQLETTARTVSRRRQAAARAA
jgi:DNA-directed RNA polymerase specialized sigma24 family protein